jgi:uncharacterized membrane protein YraQ (UPF0718 family)
MTVIKKFKAPLLMAALFIILWFWLPDIAARSTDVAFNYLKEMVLVIPPVFVLMGLLEVWVPKEKITQLIGSGSGIKGILFSFLMGTLPTGPLYIAFPLAGSLLNKGARISNIVIFLGAWAAIKIPQLVAEMEFMGLPFTALRFVLTLTAVILIGQIMEILIKPDDVPSITNDHNSQTTGKG